MLSNMTRTNTKLHQISSVKNVCYVKDISKEIMSLHYIVLTCKKLVTILEMGKDGDQSHNCHIFGFFSLLTLPLTWNRLFDTIFSPWFCLVGRDGTVVALYSQEKTLAFDRHFRALDDRYSVPYEIFFVRSFLRHSQPMSKFLSCILEDAGHSHFTKRTPALHNFLQFSTCSA